MITISKENISSVLLMEAYAGLYNAKERISLLETKYNTGFDDFERMILSGQEDFKMYDDYIEWKAFLKVLNETEKRIKNIRNGNFKVA